jgi:hypothetical protein
MIYASVILFYKCLIQKEIKDLKSYRICGRGSNVKNPNIEWSDHQKIFLDD